MKRQVWTISSPLESDKFAWLDKLADPLQAAAHQVFGANKAGRTAKNILNGVPFRHRMHPALIIVPLGAWTTAVLLDALDVATSGDTQKGFRRSADASIALGLVSVVPTAAAGIADWVDLYDHHRRVGTAHALLNNVAATLYGTSLGLRLLGKRGAGRATAGLGYAVVLLSGMLGGEMVYNLGVNVPRLLHPKPPTDYVDVLASGDLPQGTPLTVEVGRVPVMLYRQGGQAFAVEAWCTHAGGPLAEGKFDGTTVECPWHGSCFDLTDGRPLQGPATAPLHTFEVQEQGGRIRIRPSYEGQEWPPPPEPPKQQPVTAGA